MSDFGRIRPSTIAHRHRLVRVLSHAISVAALASVLCVAINPPAVSAQSAHGSWRTTLVGRTSLQDDLRNSIGDRVFFAAGSSELEPRALAMLAAHADWLNRNPEVVAIVEGHADGAEGAEDLAHESGLALVRAEHVRGQLVMRGVGIDRVRVASYGANEPIAVCGAVACHARIGASSFGSS